MGWKMPVVLSCMFCLMINCLSACFDRISALSAGCGCHIITARGTKNFETYFVRSGNRHKFTSMFICASLALPCASVARCRTKFQVPLAALKMHPYFGEPGSYHVKHWKSYIFYNPLHKPHKLYFQIILQNKRGILL